MKRLEEIRALATAATPGPWQCQIPAMTGAWPTGKIKPLKIQGKLYHHPMLPIADASYIAALNPSVVLALCEALEVAIEALKDADNRFYTDGNEESSMALEKIEEILK